MKVALIHPPSCDPTAPYLALPALTAYLRQHDVEVLPIDANVLAYERLLTAEALGKLARRVGRRLERQERRPRLSHAEQLTHATDWAVRGDAETTPAAIAEALAVLRDRSGRRFYDPVHYGAAVATVQSALDLIGAAHSPLQLGLASYRTPFSLLTPAEILADAAPARDPFHDLFAGELPRLLADAGVGLVGISVAFPGQLQPAFSLAYALRAALPGVYLVAGGPALSQLLVRQAPEAWSGVLGPFDSAVLFEGEEALLELTRAVARGERPRGVVRGGAVELASLPAPDFAGLPLGSYLSPEPVLPYDPSRGCYWGRCTFCHYGLTDTGTARFRQRPPARVADDLLALARSSGSRLVYLSQDSMPPPLAEQLALRLAAAGTPLRWATDMRPEPALSPERCRTLRAGGQLAASLGIESGAPRVLERIDKGVTVSQARAAVAALAGAGIAVEAMTFTDFPGETLAEALQTVRLLAEQRERLALFICGSFHLVHGSAVARRPADFGISGLRGVAGDELGTALLFDDPHARRPAEQARLDQAIDELAGGFRLRSYPWAGSLSTAHTLLWYVHHGPGVFRALADEPADRPIGARALRLRSRFSPPRLAAQAGEAEAGIWHELVQVRGAVSRPAYEELAAALPSVRAAALATTVVVEAGSPVQGAEPPRTLRPVRRGPRAGRRR